MNDVPKQPENSVFAAGPPSETLIRTHLARILSSERFVNSSALSRFLSFVVEEALKGRKETLKEYSIGVAVFSRGESFDSRVNPIVRVQAGKLRDRLEQYYEHEGKQDALRIELPKGGYVPVFRVCQIPEADTSAASRQEPELRRNLTAAVRVRAAAMVLGGITVVAGVRWLIMRPSPQATSVRLI